MTQDRRRDLLDALEGFYVVHILDCLHRLGLLEALRDGARTTDLCAGTELDATTVESLLAYLAIRTRIVDRVGDRYFLGQEAPPPARQGFLLDQYAGAYGPNARRLDEVIGGRDKAAAIVDRDRHARAFARLERPSFPVLPTVIRELGVHRLVEVGSGTAALLIALAGRDPDFRGWGIEASAAMCDVARTRVEAEGVRGRVEVVEADARGFRWLVRLPHPERLEAVVAASFINELFGNGNAEAIDWLRRLKQRLPGRVLLVADYYGQLGHSIDDASRWGLLHDLVQAISGQGVPPPDMAGWQELYSAAGCRLLHCFEGEGGVPWFIHVVRLDPPAGTDLP